MGVAFATFVPLNTSTIPYGCGIQEPAARDVIAKMVAQAVVIVSVGALLAPTLRFSSTRREMILAAVGALIAAAGFGYAYFGASLGLEMSRVDCGGAWRTALLIAPYWSSPAIALLLDLGTTRLLRLRRQGAWCVAWSAASLLMHAVGYWSLATGT